MLHSVGTLRQSIDPVLLGRDPELIRRVLPVLEAFSDYYYRAEVQGTEHLTDRASLIVATHNGIWTMADIVAFSVAFWRRFPPETPVNGMVHRAFLAIPGIGTLIRGLGGLPASQKAGRAVLRAGRPLFVCPGGDIDAMKAFRLRHTVQFGKRRGFVRLALREGVPVIPVVSVGAHETLLVLNDGRRLARSLGIDRWLRIKTLPITLSFPLGLTIAGVPSIPLPSKVVVRVLPPMLFDEPPSAADDPAAVTRCFDRLRATMQEALTSLASERKHVFFG